MASRQDDLGDALEALVRKLDACDRPLTIVCNISELHGVPYSGPNWHSELIEAKRALGWEVNEE